jgi:hypothetical protein
MLTAFQPPSEGCFSLASCSESNVNTVLYHCHLPRLVMCNKKEIGNWINNYLTKWNSVIIQLLGERWTIILSSLEAEHYWRWRGKVSSWSVTIDRIRFTTGIAFFWLMRAEARWESYKSRWGVVGIFPGPVLLQKAEAACKLAGQTT